MTMTDFYFGGCENNPTFTACFYSDYSCQNLMRLASVVCQNYPSRRAICRKKTLHHPTLNPKPRAMLAYSTWCPTLPFCLGLQTSDTQIQNGRYHICKLLDSTKHSHQNECVVFKTGAPACIPEHSLQLVLKGAFENNPCDVSALVGHLTWRFRVTMLIVELTRPL